MQGYLFEIQLFAYLVGKTPDGSALGIVRRLNDQFPERLANFDLDTVPERRPEGYEPKERVHRGGKLGIDERLVRRRKVTEVNTRLDLAISLLEVLVHG